jgi:hypothetical protein
MNPQMTAEEQSAIELLARLPKQEREHQSLWNKISSVFEAGSFAENVALCLTNRKFEQPYSDYASAWLKQYHGDNL